MRIIFYLLLSSVILTGNSMTSSPISISDKVSTIISHMTVEEKIGQMTQVDRRYLLDDNDIRKYFLGSLLSGGNGGPEDNTAKGWLEMYKEYQNIAMETRLGIPLIYGVDAVHGHNNIFGTTIFPHNIGLGCTMDPDLVKRVAEITAIEVAATGLNWTFSPCVAVPGDIRWGRAYEGFSQDPQLTSTLGVAAVKGYQGNDLSKRHTILACSKHYVGDGGAAWGTGDNDYTIDRGDAVMNEDDFRRIHLPPYVEAVNNGVGSVMVSYSSWNGEKCHGHAYLITDVLKNELGFEGFVVSDWAGFRGIAEDQKSDIVKAINAGIDMIMLPGSKDKEEEGYIYFLKLFKEAVLEKSISMDRIDDAVTRILKMKFELGLFEKPLGDDSLLKTVGSVEHREVAREAVRKSLVVLKNEDNLFPLKKSGSKILVAGEAANDIGMQCGGWSITWQGIRGDITVGTTILEGIQNTVVDKSQVIFSADGSGGDDATIGIVVIGEEPYAEGYGDRADLSLSDEDLMLLSKMKDKGIPTVVILLSGRPLIITDHLKDMDVFIAAWLPGTEGQGIADILFGDFPATGKLSFTWPRSMDQIPLQRKESDTKPLFPYGYKSN